MARREDSVCTPAHKPQTPEEIRLCDHVRAVFGWTPDAIRSLVTADQKDGPYVVQINSGCKASLEFICAEGMLIGIPPKSG